MGLSSSSCPQMTPTSRISLSPALCILKTQRERNYIVFCKPYSLLMKKYTVGLALTDKFILFFVVSNHEIRAISMCTFSYFYENSL